MKKLLLLFVALTLILSACSKSPMANSATSSSNMLREEMGMSPQDAPPSVEKESAAYDSGGFAFSVNRDDTASPSGAPTMSGEVDLSAQKLIRTANFNMETMEYDATLAAVEDLVAQYGGYIQSSSTTGAGAIKGTYQITRNAYYTLRIPVESFFVFYDGLAQCGSVTYSNHSAQDVSDYYYDTEARLKTLRIQEERLLTLMSQATELEAIIQLESTLADVRYQIESHEGTLRRLDSQISYSTFEVSIYEVFEPTYYESVATTLGQRINQRFQSTWRGLVRQGENIIVWLLGDSIEIILTLALIGLIVLAVRAIYRRTKARRNRKNEPPRKDTPPEDDPGNPKE